MKLPIQLWVPTFQISPLDDSAKSDLLRAQRDWRGEERVWLSTAERETRRWKVQRGPLEFSECIIPADTDNLLDIYHIDKSGLVFPSPQLPAEWNNKLPQGLYQRWLNVMPKAVEGPRTVSMEFPTVGEEGVSNVVQTFEMDPGPIAPIVGIEEDRRFVQLSWSPLDTNAPTTISPETESRRRYGHLKYVPIEPGGPDVVMSEGDPEMLAMNVWLQWPEPFGWFFRDGGRLDLLSHQAFMRRCVADWADGRRHQALQQAQTWVSELTGEAVTSMESAWFRPRVSGSIEGLLMDVFGSYGIDAKSLDDLLKSKEFLAKRQSATKCTRVQGWLGYFWLELYTELSGDITVKFCENCERVIRGGACRPSVLFSGRKRIMCEWTRCRTYP